MDITEGERVRIVLENGVVKREEVLFVETGFVSLVGENTITVRDGEPQWFVGPTHKRVRIVSVERIT